MNYYLYLAKYNRVSIIYNFETMIKITEFI